MIFHILLPYLMVLDKNYSCELEKKNNDKFTIISFLIGKETKPLSLRRVRDPENFRDRSQRTPVSHGFSTNEGQQLDCFPHNCFTSKSTTTLTPKSGKNDRDILVVHHMI